jgi:DNA-binding transcriptional LysR family regulator
MHIKLRHIEVFHAVMEEGSVSKAASRLNLSQPAVSTALSRLEDLVGYSLFYRSKGHFSPRPEAFQLKSDAELSVMAIERFANRARLIGRGGTGFLRVGSIGGPAFAMLPQLISDFGVTNPLVDIDLQVRSSAQISYLVGNGQLDIGLVEAPVAAASVSSIELKLPCVCIFREDSPLAAKPFVEPHDIMEHRLIGIEKANQVDRRLAAACSAQGVAVHASVNGFFFAVVRRMIAHGGGVALVDALNGALDLDDGVIWRPFVPRIQYDIALVTHSATSLSAPAEKFIDAVRSAFAQVNEELSDSKV